MATNWLVRPPLTAEEGPTAISVGSLIRKDFAIINDSSESEISTSLRWTGLSRQDVANLRNMARSNKLRDLLYSQDCGIDTGFNIDMKTDPDPFNATFYLTISRR